MATNEETKFTQMNKEEKKNNVVNHAKEWQHVTIGGVSGILMGAGAVYAANALAKEKSTEKVAAAQNNENVAEGQTHNGIKVAEVDQSLSFGQAFETARNSVGSGGVFHWHGNVYNTYTKEEWDNMTPEAKSQFAQQVQPEINSSVEYTNHSVDDYAHDNVKPTSKIDPKPKAEKDNVDEDDKPQTKPEEESDGEIHFLGFTNVEIEGEQYVAGHASKDDKHVYFLDMDNDPEHQIDHVAVDVNNDNVITQNEVGEFEGKATMEEFGVLSLMEASNESGSNGQTAMTNQDEIAPDMPDYVNDANI